MRTTTPRQLARHRMVVCIAAVVLAVGACSANGASSGDSTGSAKSTGKVELTFWSWVPGFQKVIDYWNATHPNVHVDYQVVPGPPNAYAKMRSSVKAGNPPDVATIEYHEIPGFVLDNDLVDLAKYGANGDKSKFVEWQWQQGVFGSSTFAIPQASGPMGLFYRADVFHRLGLKPPTTWAEFESAAKKIHAKNHSAYISVFPPADAAWFTALSWQAGAKWFGTRGNTWLVNIDNPKTEQVASYWDRLVREKLVKVGPDSGTGFSKDLQDGNVAAWVCAQWCDNIIRTSAPKTSGKWRAAPIPQWTAGADMSANWGGSAWVVLKGSKHPQQAKDFAVWMLTNKTAIDKFLAAGYGWPAAKNAYTGSSLNKADPFFGGQRYNSVFAASDEHIDESWRWIPTIDATFQQLTTGFQAATSGKGTFVDAVRQAQQQTLSDMKAKGLDVEAGS